MRVLLMKNEAAEFSAALAGFTVEEVAHRADLEARVRLVACDLIVLNLAQVEDGLTLLNRWQRSKLDAHVLAMTSGDHDLEVDVMCRDNDHLVDFVNQISKFEGVNQTKTTIYFKVYKYAQPDLGLLKK